MTQQERAVWDARFIERDPWLWPLARAATRLSACNDWPLHAELDAIYVAKTRSQGRAELCFRPITPRDRGRRASAVTGADQLYDGLITLQGVVPTRSANWHDLLNALCFATWPKSKLALHARQYRAQAERLQPGASRLPHVRTREQDALTIFDEGGVVVIASDAARTRIGSPTDASFAVRVSVEVDAGTALVVPFGHALFEHMVAGIPVPGSSARMVSVARLGRDVDEVLCQVDDALLQMLQDWCCFCMPREAAHLRLSPQMLRRPAASESPVRCA